MRPATTLTLTALLAPGFVSCAAGPPEEIYTGPLTPIAGFCDPPAQSTLTVRGASVLFAPASATIILQGTRTASTLRASLTLSGADKQPYTLVFAATQTGASIAGDYVTPRCRYRVSLIRR